MSRITPVKPVMPTPRPSPRPKPPPDRKPKPKELSSGFTGSGSRTIDDINREVETRMAALQKLGLLDKNLKHLDVFTDDFDSPSDAFNEVPTGGVKKSGPYQKPHDDYVPEADPTFVHMAASGRSEDQPYLDEVDKSEQEYDGRIKPKGDQFPMSKKMVSGTEKADNADINDQRIEEKPMTKCEGPEHFDKEVEKRMRKRLGPLWNKAKNITEKEYGKDKWPVIQTIYKKEGGK